MLILLRRTISDLKKNLRRTADLDSLCKGWNAVYEVWELDAETHLVFRIVVPIDPVKLHSSLRKILEANRASRTGIEPEIDMAIKPDLKAFSILKTLFVLSPSTCNEPHDKQTLLQHELPVHAAQVLAFREGLSPRVLASKYFGTSASSYNVHFDRVIERLVCQELDQNGADNLTIVTYGEMDHGKLGVIEHSLKLSPAEVVQDLVFHPDLALLLFRVAFLFTDGERFIIWQYRSGKWGPLETKKTMIDRILNARIY